jgi:hypothetical protein
MAEAARLLGLAKPPHIAICAIEVMEKQLAAMRAHLAYTESILNGEATSALGAYFDVYQRAVESNRKRLSNRRWRWLRRP